MKPLVYSDIGIINGATVGKGGISTLPVATRLFSVLHGIFRGHPGRFALGFPMMREREYRHPGHIFRVFMESEEDWRIVYGELDRHERIGSRIHLFKDPFPVPENFSGPWIEYRRFRIPSRKSTQFKDKETGIRLEKSSNVRENRLDLSEKWPFFMIRSQSTGHCFSLHIEKKEGIPIGMCLPDGFGLSTGSKPFSLPMVG